jgi:hypothetical protein
MSEYDIDILRWSEHQAALLRRLAGGERVNDQAAFAALLQEVDWTNVIDEVETVGRNELRATESHLVQALLHDLKAEGWPLSRDVPHWRAEARGHRDEARRAFAPSMRQRINLAALYREALRRMPETIDGVAPLPVPQACPVTLDKMLTTEDDG